MALNSHEIERLRKKHILSALSTSYKKHLHIVRGNGQYLISATGERYLDCVNNVCHVGHCHPKVVEACCQQIATLNTNTRYLHENIVNYAKELTSTFPEGLDVAVFCCSGSEANEAALRMGRNFAGSNDTIVIDHGYHGNTTALIGISPYKYQDQGKCLIVPKPDTTHVLPIPDMFRGKYNKSQGYTEEELSDLYIEELKNLIKKIESENRKVGVFIHEAIMGCGGQVPFPPNFLPRAYDLIHKAGGVNICDEVQVGFGRVGECFWGFQLQNCLPDIVTMGKPMGNGFPLGGVVTTSAIANAFKTGIEYFNTFGGNPVACAVGLAVLKVIKEEKLQENALETGNYFKSKLKELEKKYKLVGEARGHGLFLGLELVHENLRPATKIAGYIKDVLCRKHHICLSTDGPHENVMKVKPPIVFNKQNVDYVIYYLDYYLNEIENGDGIQKMNQYFAKL